jgi:hypothetical protein
VELFGEGDWTACFAVLRKEGPHGLLARVRALEAADEAAGGPFRWKLHDDATAVFAVLP